MAEEILPNIFREEIPLPQNPLKAINSYVIKEGGRFLMIDTGMNRPECLQAMQAYIKEIGVDLEKTDFFITHLMPTIWVWSRSSPSPLPRSILITRIPKSSANPTIGRKWPTLPG